MLASWQGQSEKLDRQQELALVRSTMSGNKDAFRQLVEAYQQRAFRVAYDVLRNQQDAEDVVQESFVKAYLSLHSFKGDSSFYTWLYRIVFNMAIDVKRKITRSGRHVVVDDIGSLSEEPVSSGVNRPDRQVSGQEELGILAKAMDELSEDQRQVLMLREVDGLSYEEISAALDIKEGTVMSRLFYARKRLHEIFERYLVPSASFKIGAAERSDLSNLVGVK